MSHKNIIKYVLILKIIRFQYSTNHKLPFNCHYFMVQDNEFKQWLSKK